MRILWLKTGPLHPADAGGKIRTLGMLRAMHQQHEITYLALCPKGTLEESRRFDDFATSAHWVDAPAMPEKESAKLLPLLQSMLTSRLPYVAWAYHSAGMTRSIETLHAEKPFDLIVCDFLFPAANCLRTHLSNPPPRVLFQHNVESMIWKRRFESESGIRKWVSGNQWRRLQRHEKSMCEQFDGIITVSEEDTRLHREIFQLNNILGDVPTGVDLDFFAPLVETPRTNPPFLAFVGSMDWAANIDGVLEFHRQVWPNLKKAHPNLHLKIIGRRPVDAILTLAEQEHIEVTGTVEDVRPHLQGGSAMIVPLRIGGGTRLKIYEAMAAGIPVISTQVGAEGLPMAHDHEILMAQEIVDLESPILRLLANPELGERIAANALARVKRDFSWGAAADKFIALLNPLLKQR